MIRSSMAPLMRLKWKEALTGTIDLPDDYTLFDKGDTVTLKLSNMIRLHLISGEQWNSVIPALEIHFLHQQKCLVISAMVHWVILEDMLLNSGLSFSEINSCILHLILGRCKMPILYLYLILGRMQDSKFLYPGSILDGCKMQSSCILYLILGRMQDSKFLYPILGRMQDSSSCILHLILGRMQDAESCREYFFDHLQLFLHLTQVQPKKSPETSNNPCVSFGVSQFYNHETGNG